MNKVITMKLKCAYQYTNDKVCFSLATSNYQKMTISHTLANTQT